MGFAWHMARLDPNTACSQFSLQEKSTEFFGVNPFGSPLSTTADSKSDSSSGKSPQDLHGPQINFLYFTGMLSLITQIEFHMYSS